MSLICSIVQKKLGITACLCFLVLMGVILGCNGENKIYRIEKRSDLGISLIEHVYVFEEEGYEVHAFFVAKEAGTNEYVLHLVLQGNILEFAEDHRAFIHGFKRSSDKDKSINMVVNNPKTHGDTLVFSKALSLKKDSLFEKINFGVEDKITKQRKFVLTLNNVDVHKFPQLK